jgi:hypothetical protein
MATSIDASFGEDGKVITNFRLSRGTEALGVRIGGDGRIAVVGRSRPQGSQGVQKSKFTLARYNADGSSDTMLGRHGCVVRRFGRRSDFISSVAFQEDGKIIAVGGNGVTAGRVWWLRDMTPMVDATGHSASTARW